MTLSALSYQALLHVHCGLRRIAPCDVDRVFDATMDHLFNGLRPASRRSSFRR
jgi:hypothetical protein